MQIVARKVIPFQMGRWEPKHNQLLCMIKRLGYGLTRDLSATRGKKSAHLKWAAHGLRVEPRKMRKRHLSMGPRCGSWSRYNGYRVEQHNVIIDVLGARGYSKQLEKSARKLLGARARGVLEWMQNSVISDTLNIARTLAKCTRIIHHNQLLTTKSVQSLQQDIVSNCVECCAKIQQDHQGHMLRVHF